MAKTYNSLSTVTVGSVLTASDYNDALENLNNHRVPPSVRVFRSSDASSYTSAAAISWNAEAWDTDDMFTATSTNITVQTSGLYACTFYAYAVGSATITLVTPTVLVGGSSRLTTTLNTGTTGGRFVLSGVLDLAATNVVTASVTFSGGSAYTIGGNASSNDINASHLTLQWLGQKS
jgi:hypothetical protein